MGIAFALLTGLTSAVIYSLIQGCYRYFQWSRTKYFFTWEIRTSMTYMDYYVATILDIETIYTEYGEEHLITHEEFIAEVESVQISKGQYKKLNHIIKNTKSKIETLRKEALSVPTFTSPDFHAVDKFLIELNNLLSYYSWVEDDSDDSSVDRRLKGKLVSILNAAEKNPFHEGLLDNLWKWYRLRNLNIKKIGHEDSRDKAGFSDEMPF